MYLLRYNGLQNQVTIWSIYNIQYQRQTSIGVCVPWYTVYVQIE